MMKTSTKRSLAVVAAAGLLVTLGGVGGATASRFVTSSQIKDGTIRLVDMHSNASKAYSKPGPRGTTGARGATGEDGKDSAESGSDGEDGTDGSNGTDGANGANGTNGKDGANGKDAPDAEYGVATVNVKRGEGNASAWATYSTALGSPVVDTTGGSFRFTCSTASCTVSVKATAFGTGDDVKVHPRVLIMRQDRNNGGPEVYCEYGDGSTDSGFATVDKQSTSDAPDYSDMQLNIGGSADCDGPDSTSGNVDKITVPAGYYDVASTFSFVS